MIKNILFDLGAVILKINLEAYLNELKLLVPGASFDFDHEKHQFYMQFERGAIDEPTFFANMEQALETPVSIEKLQTAWSKILIEPYQESKDFLERVNSTHRLFLLSNTNAAHRRQFDGIFDRHWGKGRFYAFFDQVFYSYQMNMIKPQPEIFEAVLQEANIAAADTLFIDDNLANVQAASKLGFHTWHFGGVNDWPLIQSKFDL
ncbi:HAD-IA family hydrolase [bacterium]|nr:HAD-IA family hydrolase [bacterium]